MEGSQAVDSEVAVEFAEVVAGGEQFPLAAGVAQAAEQDVFALQGGDLTEDRLDDRLAPGIAGRAGLGAELAGHPLLEGVVLWDPAARRRFDDLVVTEPTGGDQELGAVLLGELRGGLQVRLRAVPGISQGLLGGRPVLRRASSIIGVKLWLSAAQLSRSVAMIT